MITQHVRATIVLMLLLAMIIGPAADIALYSGRSDNVPADAAIVLGAAVDGDTPTPVYAERLRHAAQLFRDGQVRWIVVTGGLGYGDSLTESESGRDWLVGEGIPRNRILIEMQSHTTKQNFAFALPLLAQHDLKRVLVVSDPLHMRRAMRMALDVGINAHPSPTQTSRYDTLGAQIPMLLREAFLTIEYFVTRQ